MAHFIDSIEYAVPVTPSGKVKFQADTKGYSLYSLAKNIKFYRNMNKLDITGFEKRKGSLDRIIQATLSSTSTLSSASDTISLDAAIGRGSINDIFSITGSTNKVFRMLDRRSMSQYDTFNLRILIRNSNVKINITSIKELYGLIIQYYFTGVCHPNICRVYDFGIMDYNGSYIAYAILQRVTNDIFRFFYHSEDYKSLTLHTFKGLFKKIFEAITCIHSHGFVHLDIKPGNIGYVQSDRGDIQPLLLDFGFTAPIGSELCVYSVFGTAAYLVPGWNRYNCNIRSDIYAFIVMLAKILFQDKNTYTIPEGENTKTDMLRLSIVKSLAFIDTLLSNVSEKRLNDILFLTEIYLYFLNDLHEEQRKNDIISLIYGLHKLYNFIFDEEVYTVETFAEYRNEIDSWFDLTVSRGGNKKNKYKKSQKIKKRKTRKTCKTR